MRSAVRPPNTEPRRAWLLPLALAVALGLAVPEFTRLVRVWGRQIPQPAIEADYAFGLLWSLALAASILVWPAPLRDKRPLLILWGARCVVTLGFMLLYEHRYGLDAYAYFAESTQLRSPLQDLKLGRSAGTDLIGGLAWHHSQLLMPSYHALKVSFAMVGLVAVYVLYRAGILLTGREDHRVLYLLGFFPSILFWGSTLGKEPIVLLGIALYVYGALGLSRRRNPGYVLPLLAGVTLAVLVRLWLGPILLFPLVLLAVRALRGAFSRTVFVLAAIFALHWTVGRFANEFALETAEDLFSLTDGFSRGWEGGSWQQRSVEITSVGSMLRFAPVGAFTALFRPLPGEVLNPFGLLAGVENMVLLATLVGGLWRGRPKLRDPVVQWAILLTVTWAVVYGFVSYQNLGAAVRFKLQILPVMIGLAVYLRREPRTHDPGVPAERTDAALLKVAC